MKLTVLVDNNTYIDQYYLGEPGVSYYIECENEKFLFDVGYSNIFMKNAEKMNIDLNDVKTIILSHGHNDHTRGLQFIDLKDKTVLAHPHCFNEKYVDHEYIGVPFTTKQMQEKTNLCLQTTPMQLTNNLYYLGEIPRTNDFENQTPIGKQNNEDDYLLDDTALVYKTNQGLFIITGCSHSGICNIIDYSKKVCNEDKILGVLGGFHLFDLNEQTIKTIDYLESNKIENLYPCHCVSLQVKCEMMKRFKIHEVGVSLTLEMN